MRADARREVRLVDARCVAGRLQDFVVLDVREPAEVLLGYLPGALNVPRGKLEFFVCRDGRFADRDASILVYSGDGRRSALAAQTLRRLGFRNVLALDRGIRHWSEANLPVD